MVLMRLQKYLSSSGICSRREGEKHIKAGIVSINGEIVTRLGTKVDPERDRVEINGKPVKSILNPVYIALNKPKGYVSSCRQKDARTVLDLLDISQRVYPVGRLDKDSTGLLLLTNDGRLHFKLSHPSFNHEKEYEVTVANPIPDSSLQRMAQGMLIMGKKTRPAKIGRISSKRFSIVLKEGRNRQIRRMVRKLGTRVTGLKRIRTSNIRLGDLPEGGWRHLTEKEKRYLIQTS
ncbi:MAG TPA: rRNA pseudouridine synthase [Desulfobacteraceae bacterium]|nr:rRNA pseudouridine synthase [Desulfobacteraceae bacterium]